MQQIDDAKTCIIESRIILNDIKVIYYSNLYQDTLPSSLKIKIKNFLENCRSSLEYIANYTFYKYCSNNYTEKELQRLSNGIYFPIKNSKIVFDKCISSKYKGLDQNIPILNLFESIQPFNSEWLEHLKILSNKNKHVNFTKQNRYESGHIDYMQDSYGNTFSNITSNGCKHIVTLNGKPVTMANISSNPFINSFIGNIYVEFVFDETNTPILNTLFNILHGVEEFISKYEKLL
ncbi:hypothetical protein [Clostridium paraputrificum]|uniref:hypothetical protein n=1 Tax=Clostridium paraputrificum TaxID=29363 RepID=UPI00374F8FEF